MVGRSGYILGVDLGTTFTAAAVWHEGHAEVVPLGDHSPQIPSAVFRTSEGEFLVGEAALRRGAADPSGLATEFKRRIGDDTNIMVAGTPMSAHALMAHLLTWVVGHVSTGQGGPPATTVLTCPANWGPYRRELLEQAGRMAGLGSVVLCTEPSAAAVHFASTERVETGDTVAVYDLGGGTFDAAVLRKDGPASFALLGSPEGIEHLGGLDFDAAVLQHVWTTLGDVDVDPDDEAVLAGLNRLRRECTDAKEALSVDTDVTIPVDLGDVHRTVRLGRAELEEVLRPSLEETVAAVERSLASASLTVAELDSVLLVGGSARIPLVTELLTRQLSRPVAVSAHPKHGVALGAAMVGAQVSGAIDRSAASSSRSSDGSGGTAASARPVGGAAVLGTAGEGASGSPSAGPKDAGHGAAPSAAGAGAGAASGAPPLQQTPPKQSPRRAALARRSLLAAAILAALALLALTIGPTAGDPQLTTQLDAGREVATLDGTPVQAGSRLQLTLAGQDLPSGSAVVTDQQTVNLSGARIYAVGPLRATVSGPDGTQLEATAQLLPPDGPPWGRLLSLPGAIVVLGLLFAFAYGESLLRPVLRQARPVRVVTMAGMGAIGAVLGVVLVLATWILGARLHSPVSVVLALLCCIGAVGLVPLGLEHRARVSTGRSARPT
ncbi:Hsp70 family protein [Ornithinimicrobium ciconiae]|uniref:Hsp70 family protein n=1 Tax=Ornithinimicrobium ciconiae TaxID=2594265 RepID=A0A516GEQ9_9MICO|nr:Hsp70 family protein [Ornithinimicrobium ciconiae]QDO90017.1 Hsp70 family protein [Ornithinimicrobium ciconiae]